MGEHAAALAAMAAQLAAVLQVQGNQGWSKWSELHGKLAEVAAGAGGDDPRKAVQDLLDVAKDASPFQALMRALQESVSKANLKYLVYHVARELNMTPLGDSAPVQMVDEHLNFCKGSVDHIVRSSAELSRIDASYSVISIVGAQSSGKSYLLNRLFGTRFLEMNAKLGRSRTTEGIIMSRCIGPSLLLMDIEGYDGMENEKDTSFERQSALFALTISDVMIVNMFINNFGLSNGGGTPLFEAIFQERAKIEGAGITKMLIVLRDYDDEETPLELLRDSNLERLQQIWKRVNGASMRLEDYIKVDIFGMPKKNTVDFPKKVAILRQQLSKNISANVPASSFSESCKMYWDTIKENKRLNIPSIQELIAKSYCQGIVDNNIKALDSHEYYKLLKAEESPSRFQQIADELLRSIITKYDQETKMYDPDVRDTYRKNLVERLHESIKDLSKELIRKVHANIIEQFLKHKYDGEKIQNMKDADAFFQIMKDQQSKYVSEFKSTFKDLKLVDWDHLHKIGEELKKQLDLHADRAIKIIKHHSRDLILMAQGHTLDNFKLRFVGKNIKKIKDTNAYISTYVDEFMNSSKDSKLVDWDYLRNIGEELKKNLQAHADHKIEERERRKKELAWKAAELSTYVLATTTTAGTAFFTGDFVSPFVYGAHVVRSSIDIHNHNSVTEALDQGWPSTSQKL